MLVNRRAFTMGGVALAAASACPAFAQKSYPTRPVEFVVPWGAGGGSDQTARKLAAILEPRLGVSIPIVNLPGGTGSSGLNKMLTAPADGYTLCLLAADTVGLLAMTKPKWSLGDLSPIALLTQQHSALFLRADGPLKSWDDIDAESRKRDLKVAVSGLGTPEEAAVNFFKRRGNRFNAVPFQKPGERYSALLGGHVDVLFEQTGDVRSFIDGGQIKTALILAVETDPNFPSVPVSKAVGVDFVLDQYRGVVVKGGTDPEIVKVLTERVKDACASPEYAAYLKELWAAPDSYRAPADAMAFMETDLARLRAVL
ncbi:tripartite tricarboxylate transporter substrate binding protein [Hansschlegelia sp. KR7-227]|uniref:tripartite tricarboxylate transporter substrate binding protein n=1 Tax=Hansschlegelia sp. KR7-227 TaxID=3400914 RepID=UPI003C1068B4